MATYEVQREVSVWVSVEVEADNILEAVEKSNADFIEGNYRELDGIKFTVASGNMTGQIWVSNCYDDSVETTEEFCGTLDKLEDMVHKQAKELGMPIAWAFRAGLIDLNKGE